VNTATGAAPAAETSATGGSGPALAQGAANAAVVRFAALFAGKAAGALGALAVTALVARLLGPEGLGRWTLLAAAGAFLHTVLINWTHGATVRYGHEEWVAHGTVGATLRTRLPLVLASAAAAAGLLVLQPGDWLRRLFSAGADDVAAVVCFALAAWLIAEGNAVLQAIDRTRWLAIISPLVALTSSLVLGAMLWANRPSFIAAAVAVNAVVVLGWGVPLAVVMARAGAAPRRVEGDLRRHLRYGLPMIPHLGLAYIAAWGGHLLLNRLSTVTEVGHFALAYQVLVAAMAANGVLTMALLPRAIAGELQAPGFNRQFLAVEAPALHVLWTLATVWMVALLPAVVATLAPLDGTTTLLVLLAVLPSSVGPGLYTVLFNVQERTPALVVYTFFMTAVNLTAAIVLIPVLGAIGAAVGSAIAFAVGQACYLADQHRRLAVAARPAWLWWASALTVGVTQIFVGPGTLRRLAWALLASGLLIVVSRSGRYIDGRFIGQLFTGRLEPIGLLLNRVLVARA
jgi:O-antigen/teichoic acid export membrane protein